MKFIFYDERKRTMNTKGSLFCILFLLAAMWCFADQIEVVNFSFEQPGTEKIKGWNGEGVDGTPAVDIPGWVSDTVVVDSGVETGYTTPTDGDWTGFIMSSDPPTYNLTDYDIVEGETYCLLVDARDNWTPAETTRDLQLTLYYDDAGTRIAMGSATFDLDTMGTDVGHDAWKTFALYATADSVAAGHKLGIEIDNVSTGDDSWHGLDNVRLDVIYVSPIYPKDGQMYIPIDTDLSWTVVNDWNVDVYLSGPYADPNDYPVLTQVVSNQAVTSYNPPTDLINNRWYYWQVDALEPNAFGPGYVVHEGPIWSFKTAGLAPESMSISPAVGQSVAVGSNAVFEAGGINVIIWTWYKEGNPTPLSTGPEYIVDANELTVLNADINDEGFYYCVGSNLNTVETAQTESAQLLLERLVGHWKLDYNLDDSVTDVWPTADAYPGTMVDPNYVAGIDDGAIDILTSTAPYRYITVPDTNEICNFYPLGMTVSAWIKTTEAGYGGILSKSTREPQIGWVMEHNGDTIYMIFRGGGSANVDGSIADDEWHLVAGTYDPVSGITSVYASYVDEYGVTRIAEDHSGVNRNFTFANDQPFRIGIETSTGDTNVDAYVGLIDDARVYSYAMDISEIAQNLYLPIAGGSVCADPAYDERFDFTNDCKTNLDDFAEFASAWLASGLFTP
jgi:hypothetical protein